MLVQYGLVDEGGGGGVSKNGRPVLIFKENMDVQVSIFSIKQVEGQKWNIQYS